MGVWSPDRSFAGLTVVVIGGGPSHADIDLALLAGHRFIAINSSCIKVRPAATSMDMLYFSDNSWAASREHLVRDWPGLVVTVNRQAAARLGDPVRRIDVVALTEYVGVMADRAQASSGHIVACLAAIMGAAKLVLVGFEAQPIDGRTHGHDDYTPRDLAAAFRDCFVPGWRSLAPAFSRMGLKVVNATPCSAIKEFQMMPLAEALR